MYPKELFLHVSRNCNFSCSYCWQKKSLSHMKPLTAYNAIKIFFKAYPDEPKRITFFGGEPLLNFTLIESAVSYLLRNHGNQIEKKILSIVICTNGFLLDERKIDFCLKNKIVLAISFDGSPVSHDICRKKGNEIEQKLILIKKRHYSTPSKKEKIIRLLWTLDSKTINGFYENFKYLIEKLEIADFVHSLNIEFSFLTSWTRKDHEEVFIQSELVANYYLENLSYFNDLTVRPLSVYVKQYFKKNTPIRILQTRCTDLFSKRCDMGSDFFWIILPEGTIIGCTCFEAFDIFIKKNPLILGNVNKLNSEAKVRCLFEKREKLNQKIVLNDLTKFLNNRARKKMTRLGKWPKKSNKICLLAHPGGKRHAFDKSICEQKFFDGFILASQKIEENKNE